MTLEKFLIKKYGFSADMAEKIVKASRMKDAGLVEKKLDAIFDFLKMEQKDQKRLIQAWPHLLNMSPELFKEKAEFFNSEYKIPVSSFRTMVKSNLMTVSVGTDTIRKVEKYYVDTWGFSRTDFIKKMKRTPAILGYKPETINEKMETLQERYSYNDSDIVKLLSTYGHIPCVNLEEIYKTEEFFKEEFGVDRESFAKMLKSGKPIGYSRVKFFKQFHDLNRAFRITNHQYGVMVCKSPTLLGLESVTVAERMYNEVKLGIDLPTVIENPRSLNIAPDKLEIRYKIAKINDFSDKHFLNGGFMTDQNVAYARSKYVEEKKLPHSYIYYTEAKFKKRTEMDSADLVKMYPLTEDVIENINKEFSERLVAKREHINE